MMPRVIGLVGGSGAGKSTVASLLERRGAVVIDADKVSHELTAPGGKGSQLVADVFGAEFLTEDGAMDRRKMAALVFSNPAQLRKLEDMLHPLMREEILQRIWNERRRTVVLDCAVLMKPRFRDLVDEIWLVTAPPGVRSARIQHRDGLTALQAQARISAQGDEKEMREAAGVVLENDGDEEKLLRQLEEALSGGGEGR